MRNIIAIIFIMALFSSCIYQNNKMSVKSPDGKIAVVFKLINGEAFYSVSKTKLIIDDSKLGFIFKNLPALNKDFKIVNISRSSFDEIWTQPWGEVKNIRNNYNELKIELQESSKLKRKLNIIFKVYNDGVGFRYEVPEQENIGYVEITDEETEFNFTYNYDAWWIKAYQNNRYEYLYKKNKISELDTVHTPVTFEGNGLYISLHEANLTDFASMTIFKAESTKLACDLVPWSDGVKVKTNVPFETPWRTIRIADKPGDLITSYLILNLNEPNKIEDVSWIKPMKYIGIWWAMHIGKYTWESGEKHGATTVNALEYIDFASKHNIKGLLIEGWNLGWDGNWIENGDKFNFTTPYTDFDIKKISDYAVSKNVKLIGHHETGANTINYENQMEDAFNFYNKYGVNAIKTGYVGEWLDNKEWHHGQYGVKHYRKVIELAAKHKIMLDVHEPIKATGIRRTWPNMMTREGARGQEYNAWSSGNGCEHTTILPFTRCLAGPFDYTPGVFDLKIKYRGGSKVTKTLAKELALYVIIYSPLQMACDLPENYTDQPAFKFIKDVPVDWEETKVLNAKIGDYITTVRKDKNSADWYLGSITDEEAREFTVTLDFLEPNTKYEAQIYADGKDATWKSNSSSINIHKQEVTNTTKYTIKLNHGGGQAIRFKVQN